MRIVEWAFVVGFLAYLSYKDHTWIGYTACFALVCMPAPSFKLS